MSIERNAKRMEEHVGKTIESIESNRDFEQDGFMIFFTDGTSCEVTTNLAGEVEVWSD